MMNIHNDFIGGNICVKSIDGDVITLENELRDSDEWFYWAFCIEGAEGRELTFRMQRHRIGYHGPAISHDLKEWHWLNQKEGDSFTYRFKAGECKVYFAHHALYHPERFLRFVKENGLYVTELCKSRKGRSVPCLTLGDGEKSILLTARHHACESTGSYVLEGVLSELMDDPIPNTRVLCVPFVDYDGVVDGDQGKGRAPHDHNRDYTDDPIYPEVRAILNYAEKYGCNYGFDFHSPWHVGGENDRIFIVRNRADRDANFNRFSSLLEKECTDESMCYESKNDHPACTGWNQPGPNFSFTMHNRKECALAFTLESAYFGTPENRATPQRLKNLGRCFAKSLRKYISEEL